MWSVDVHAMSSCSIQLQSSLGTCQGIMHALAYTVAFDPPASQSLDLCNCNEQCPELPVTVLIVFFRSIRNVCWPRIMT